MPYLYRHIRLDKNEPFYIGVSKSTINYNRAYDKSKRSSFWKKVVNKTDYEVEILMESDDLNFIKQKEIEFVALYGRKNLGTGTLVNLTDGGDGALGAVMSEETRQKNRERMTGEKNPFFGKTHTPETKALIAMKNSNVFVSEETRKKLSEALAGRVIEGEELEKRYREGNHVTKICRHIGTGEIFKSLKDGCNKYEIEYRLEKNRVRGNFSNKSFEYLDDNPRNLEFTCYDEITGNKYKSIAEACRELQLNYNRTRKIYKKGLSRIKSILH